MKVIVVASHSAGHIFPAIAFCQGLKERDGSVGINFISTDGEIERRILNSKDINSVLFFRKEKMTVLRICNLLGLIFRARKIINDFRPDLIVGFGGYLSIPFIICARLKKIPNFIHEQNFHMGLANKFLSRISDKVIFSFPNQQINERLKNKALFLGFPLRKEIKRLDKKEARSYFDLDSERFTLLVMGGSQGALRVNTKVINALKGGDFKDIQVIHIAGSFDYRRIDRECKDINIKYKILPFTDRMDYAFSACDLAVCRAGGGTIAEIVVLRVPSILIPYPFAKKHQLGNAYFLSKRNAAVLVEDDDSCEEVLSKKVFDLKDNSGRLKHISQALSEIDMPDARNMMADLAFSYANKN